MSQAIEVSGIVGYKGYKDFSNGRVWSLKLDGCDEWLRFGGTEPSCERGQTVKVKYEMQGRNAKAIPESLEVTAATAPPQAQPARRAARANPKEDYWQQKAIDDKDKDARISFIAAHNTAVAMLGVMASADKLPLPVKKADQLPQLQALVYALADDLYARYRNPEAAKAPEVQAEDAVDEDRPEWASS